MDAISLYKLCNSLSEHLEKVPDDFIKNAEKGFFIMKEIQDSYIEPYLSFQSGCSLKSQTESPQIILRSHVNLN